LTKYVACWTILLLLKARVIMPNSPDKKLFAILPFLSLAMSSAGVVSAADFPDKITMHVAQQTQFKISHQVLNKNRFQYHSDLKSQKMKNVKDLPIDSITPVILLPEISQNMDPASWPKGYPVPISDLVYLKLRFWGFDDKEHIGELVVSKNVAKDVLEIFTELYKEKFPIEKMELIYKYKNDDDASMIDNNTSAFNCRAVTGKPGTFSQHSYGVAIDINPKINPYIKESKNLILPENGKMFLDRSIPAKGKITNVSHIYKLFIDKGWEWGGDWKKDVKDYQHFEKALDGSKRDLR